MCLFLSSHVGCTRRGEMAKLTGHDTAMFRSMKVAAGLILFSNLTLCSCSSCSLLHDKLHEIHALPGPPYLGCPDLTMRRGLPGALPSHTHAHTKKLGTKLRKGSIEHMLHCPAASDLAHIQQSRPNCASCFKTAQLTLS